MATPRRKQIREDRFGERKRPAVYRGPGNPRQINVFKSGLNQNAAFAAAFFMQSAMDNRARELARKLHCLNASRDDVESINWIMADRHESLAAAADTGAGAINAGCVADIWCRGSTRR